MTRYMLDTNVYTFIDEEGICIESIKSVGEFFYTTVQQSELSDAPDPISRKRLLAIMHELCTRKVEADSDVWLDSLRWDDDSVWQEEANIVADRLSGGYYKRKKIHDALIGSAARQHQCVLVTGDTEFASKAKGIGIPTTTGPELFGRFK